MTKKIILLLCLILLSTISSVRAAESPKAKLASAMLAANGYLKSGNYQGASDVLEDTYSDTMFTNDGKENLELMRRTSVVYLAWSNHLMLNHDRPDALKMSFNALKYAKSSVNYELEFRSSLLCGSITEAMSNPSAAYSIYNGCLGLANSAHNKKDEAVLLQAMANTSNSAHISEATKLALHSCALAAEVNDAGVYSLCLCTAGKLYREQGNCPLALQYFTHSLSLQQKSTINQIKQYDTEGIGGLNSDLGKHKFALPYNLQATVLAAKMNDVSSEEVDAAFAGKDYDGLNQIDQAIVQYKKSLALAVKIGDTDMQAEDLGFLSTNYTKNQKFESALNCDKQALVLDIKLGNKHNIEGDYNNVSSDYCAMEQFLQAEPYSKKALNYSVADGEQVRQKADLLNLAKIDRKLGNQQAADNYSKLADAIVLP